MKIVVIGASGFLGGFVGARFKALGAQTILVSRQKIFGYHTVVEYADTPQGDILIHLAETSNRSHANHLAVNYERSVDRNLDCLLKKGYRGIVYASSSVVYGDGVSQPHNELESVSAIDTYTRVKLASENKVLSSGGVVVRLANIYGPGMAAENVISRIINQFDEDGPITLQDTSPVRDFIWVEDAAEVFIKLVTLRVQGLFNVGTGIGTSIEDLAIMLLQHARQPQRKIVSEKSSTKPSSIVLDISKTKQALHWRPSVNLNEGLQRLVNGQSGTTNT